MKKILSLMIVMMFLSISFASAVNDNEVEVKYENFWTNLESLLGSRFELYTDKYSYEPGEQVKFTTAYIANQACSDAFIRVNIECPQQNFNAGSSHSSVSNGEYVSAFIYFTIPSNIDGVCDIKSRLRCSSSGTDISDIDYQTINVDSSVSCDEGYFGDYVCQGSSIGDYYVGRYYMDSNCEQSLHMIEDCGNNNCENGQCVSGKVSCSSLGGDVCTGNEICNGAYYSTNTVNENNCCDIGCSLPCKTAGQSCGSSSTGDCCSGLDCQNFQCVVTGSCTSGETKCGIVGDPDTSGDVYYECVSGTFESQGKVDGKCGYTSDNCEDVLYGHCENVWTYGILDKSYEEDKGEKDCGAPNHCYGRKEGFECKEPFKEGILTSYQCSNALTKQEFSEATEDEIEDTICKSVNSCLPRADYKIKCVEPKSASITLSDSGIEYLGDLIGWLVDTNIDKVCLAEEENGEDGIMGLLNECIYTLPSGNCITILYAIIGLFGLVLIVNIGKK